MRPRTRRHGAESNSAVTSALLYRRISGAEHQREGLSLDQQESLTRQYIASRQGWVIAGEFCDVMSGAKVERPAYQDMLAAARRLAANGHRVAIVVVRQDRLGRNLLEQIRAREELQALGADVFSIRDGGSMSDLNSGILAVVAAEERRQIGERVADTRSHAVLSGWTWGKTAFGYQLRPATPDERAAGSLKNVIEPDPLARGVVVEAYERTAAGATLQSVANWMAALPETLRGGRAWPAQCVSWLLRTPTYVARAHEGVDDVLSRPVGRWEALVRDELWSAVQDQLATHTVRPHQASQNYLLTGFIRCDACGHRMVATTRRRNDRGGELRQQYRCTGWQRGANAPDSTCRQTVPMAQANAAVLGQVGDLLSELAEPERWPALRAAWDALDRPTVDVTVQVAHLERQIAKAQTILGNGASMRAAGELDARGYEALRDVQTRSIEAAEAERGRLQATAAPSSLTGLPAAAHAFELIGGWANVLHAVDVAHQRAILDKLVDHVVVTRTGWRQYTADITWTALGDRLTNVAAQVA